MQVAGIRVRDSLNAWLNALPQTTDAARELARSCTVTVAHRAGMRVPPGFSERNLGARKDKTERIALPILRSTLVAGVAGQGPDHRGSDRAHPPA